MAKTLEHPFDRITRLCADVVFLFEDETGFGYRHKGRGHVYYIKNPVTVLNTCARCGKTSTPKKVCIRNDVYGWHKTEKNDFSDSKSMLCMSCWAKIRALLVKEKEADELKYHINQIVKLTKGSKNGHKNEDNRRTA